LRIERASPLVGFLLWLGLLGAPLAWTAQLVIGYGAQEADCAAGSRSGDFSIHTVDAVVFGVALIVALAGLAGATWVLLRAADRPEDARGRGPFMALSGVLVSSLFGALVVMTGVGVLSFDACTPG
jgi:hypothetical protein